MKIDIWEKDAATYGISIKNGFRKANKLSKALGNYYDTPITSKEEPLFFFPKVMIAFVQKILGKEIIG